MNRIPRRVFTGEFKAEAVKLVSEQGVGKSEAARLLDVSLKSLDDWIDHARHRYPLAVLCRLLRTSRSGYLAWADGKPLSAQRLESERRLVAIRAVHAKGRGHYGPEKIRTELQAQGITVGLNHIKRLRKQDGIRCARGSGAPPPISGIVCR